MTALVLACSRGKLDVVEKLLRGGADANERDAAGHSALQHAVSSQPGKDSVRLATLLLDAGADVRYRNDVDDWGQAIHWAAARGDAGGLQVLLARGADVNALTAPSRMTPLHCAAFTNGPDVVRLLLDHDADLHAVDDAGCTALHFSVWFPHLERVKLLLARGARTDVVTTKKRRFGATTMQAGKTPLDLARRSKSPALNALLQGDAAPAAEKKKTAKKKKAPKKAPSAPSRRR